MVNTIVITDNINLVKKLLSELDKLNFNLNISKVLTNRDEMDKLIDTPNIDLVMVDKSIGKECSIEFINRFKDIIVIVSYNKSSKLINQNVLANINLVLLDGDLERKRVNIMREVEYIGDRFKKQLSICTMNAILQDYKNISIFLMISDQQ